MNKPDTKDFPPESPHDLEWGGYNHEKYNAALKRWEDAQNKETEDKKPKRVISCLVLTSVFQPWESYDLSSHGIANEDFISIQVFDGKVLVFYWRQSFKTS